jgi:predicted small lipoprotein YifL
MKPRALIATLLAIATLAACGTKGPLYLPKKSPATPGQPAPALQPTSPFAPVPESAPDKTEE